jgi:hypothetical protein
VSISALLRPGFRKIAELMPNRNVPDYAKDLQGRMARRDPETMKGLKAIALIGLNKGVVTIVGDRLPNGANAAAVVGAVIAKRLVEMGHVVDGPKHIHERHFGIDNGR